MWSENFKKTTVVASAILCAALLAPITPAFAHDGSGGRQPATAKLSSSALTLEHLRNGTYQIPDLACSYTTVPLTDGKGEAGGVRVVFGRAVFGILTTEKRSTAVVHLAYFTPEFGWLQELAFVRQQGGKLVQSAEYTLDDREDLKDVSIANGEVLLETIVHAEAPSQTTSAKLTKISLADTKQGCLLQASEWHRDPQSGRLTAQRSLAPYLSRVEDRIGKCWSPTNKDRGEHVVIAFTIQPSGQVADIHISNSSEVESADRAAMEAVVEAGPFPPLPDNSDKSLTVCLEFQAGVSVKQ